MTVVSQLEVIWSNEQGRDFLADLKSFAQFLDYYQIAYDLTREDQGKFVYLDKGTFRVSFSEEKGASAFTCPECGKTAFDVMEGDFEGKPALGLCCVNCESYGAVFPAGL
jgi:hypothetical protein